LTLDQFGTIANLLFSIKANVDLVGHFRHLRFSLIVFVLPMMLLQEPLFLLSQLSTVFLVDVTEGGWETLLISLRPTERPPAPVLPHSLLVMEVASLMQVEVVPTQFALVPLIAKAVLLGVRDTMRLLEGLFPLPGTLLYPLLCKAS
jgi:hypothetical protein